MTEEDLKTIDALRLARNAAQRAFYKTPSPEAKDAFRAAVAELDRVRGQLDPEFRKAKTASSQRWREKNKLGIPTGPKA